MAFVLSGDARKSQKGISLKPPGPGGKSHESWLCVEGLNRGSGKHLGEACLWRWMWVPESSPFCGAFIVRVEPEQSLPYQ